MQKNITSENEHPDCSYVFENTSPEYPEKYMLLHSIL